MMVMMTKPPPTFTPLAVGILCNEIPGQSFLIDLILILKKHRKTKLGKLSGELKNQQELKIQYFKFNSNLKNHI